MKKSLEETLKEVELCKEIYRLYALEHLTMSEISVKFGFALSSIHNKIRKFVFFYSFYQNNAIGFVCLRSRFHCSTK